MVTRSLLVAVAVFVTLAVWVSTSLLTIPPYELTITAIGETHERIHEYMLTHRNYPVDLTLLPQRNGSVNRTTDGWGRPLIYSVDDAGVISLTSLGHDGELGGTGDDQDVTRRYRTRNADGTLNIDDDLWLIHSQIHDSR